MKVKVYAKLNLSLNVFPKQGDFHPIDSVVTSVNLFDVVEVKTRRDQKVKLKGFMPTSENIAYKTAVAFMSQFSTNGVEICVQKGIPVGAGMGGSSADCVAVVYCMCKLFDIDVNCRQIANLCKSLGSDVTFMLRGGFARMQGKGDDVTFGECEQLYFALTKFCQGMSTAQVYSTFDSLPAPIHTDSQLLFNSLCDGKLPLQLQNNNLQLACQSLSSYAQSYLQCIKDNNLKSNMTGSGSAYYVWCASQIDAKKAVTLLKDRGFDCSLVHSVPFGIEQIS